MSTPLIPECHTGLSRLKLFWALSRTPHGLLDLATPALGALLWLGAFPPVPVTVLGLITAFAGYTAVYALNDLIDFRVDKEKVRRTVSSKTSAAYLDDVLVRHPMAHGLLSFREGLLWVTAWAILALIGAYQLNPVCVLIFLLGCALEALYCLMLRISHLRALFSGAVKTSGAMAAVFAVDPNPSALFLICLFAWFFFWEIGGQNIPHDWNDIEEDRRLQAKTIPVRLGPERAIHIILGALILTVAAGLVVFYLSPAGFEAPYVAASLVAGVYLLLFPAFRLYRTKARAQVMALFNKASYYPLALLVVVLVKLMN